MVFKGLISIERVSLLAGWILVVCVMQNAL
jgi:hypothetical protein